jgi:hypothetical protein
MKPIRFLLAGVAIATLPALVHALPREPAAMPLAADMDSAVMETVAHLGDFPVVELRRYTVAQGQRARFTAWFDTYFPEAFEQLGAMVFGQFLERGDPDHFLWLRGYHDINARPIVNSAFYYGPLWKEHRTKVNAILPDSDNVLLLQPLPGEPIPLLPAVDPVDEPRGAEGIVVAQLLPLAAGRETEFATDAGSLFDRYRIEGVRPAGVLATLDVPNNFPQLPVREDGPWLVWLGIARDEEALRRLRDAMAATERELVDGGGLRGAPETIVMDPSPRSRLRWLGK